MHPSTGVKKRPLGWKFFGFVGISVIAALLYGYVGARGTFIPQMEALIVLLFLLPLLYLQVLFTESRKVLLVLVLLESVGVALPFLIRAFTVLNVVAWFLLLLLLWGASKKVFKTKENQLRIETFGDSQAFFIRAFTAFILFVSITYINSFSFSLTTISKDTTSSVLKIMEPVFAYSIGKGFTFNVTPRQFIELQAAKQPELKKLSNKQREAAIKQAETNLRTSFLKTFHLTWDEGQTLYDAVYTTLSKQWPAWSTWIKLLFPLTIGIGMFSVMKMLGVILRPIGEILAFLLYEICRWTKLVTIEVEKRDKENIVFA